MADGTEAKDLATFIVEPVGADIYNPDSFLVRKRYQGTETTTTYTSAQGGDIFQDISDEFGDTATGFGARVYLKNGLYEVDVASDTEASVEWSDSTDGGHVSFHIQGETRDGVIIRDTADSAEEAWRIFLARCNLYLQDLTMDVADLGTHTDCVSGFGQNTATVLSAENCHFMRHTGCGIRTGAPWAALVVNNCWFDQPATFEDQIAISCSEYARITNNFFDRTNGTYNLGGSNVTAGNGTKILIANNQMKRTFPYTSFAVSLENVGGFNECTIANNIVENGWISLDPSLSANTFEEIKVYGNNVYQGGLQVIADPDSTNTKNIDIQNNTLVDSSTFGMKFADVGGRTVVKNNTIINSNKSLTSNAGGTQTDIVMVKLGSCTDLQFTDNTLEMNVEGTANADFCWKGIWYYQLTNCIIKNNTVINRTVANPSYYVAGTPNTTCEISWNKAGTA